MSKTILIDASNSEQTRIAVTINDKLDDFEIESNKKNSVKGDVYLAKITRVEPSLQAAFVEYGGSRNGFLAFNEIHPDYYQIPVADRKAILDAQLAEQSLANEKDVLNTETPLSEGNNDNVSDSINLIGGKRNMVRGKKIDYILLKIRNNSFKQATLGGCIIKKLNQTVIISKES